MTYLVSQLVTNAYYISNIVSREFETPTGQQMSDGLNILNDLLADKTINSALTPHTTQYLFTALPGVYQYFIPNLIAIETIAFFIDSVRYQMRNQQRQDYFGSFRQVNIETLPFNWHLERVLGGANLFLYFVPNQDYPMEVWGTFALASVTEFQDISLTLDLYYINYLKYELAVRLCKEYGYMIPPMVTEQLDSYVQWIASQSNTMDLKMQKLSTLSGGAAINYAVVNLSGGWLPI